MMKLWYSKTSPYARKAIITMKHHQLEHEVELLQTPMAFDSKALHNVDNPLGRVPALQMKDGSWLFGSYAISEYLDTCGQKDFLIPKDASRWQVLALHALADGILENGMPVVAERMMRPEEDWWQERQEQLLERCRRSLSQLEETIDREGEALNIGTITLVCLIDWWNLRESVLGFSIEEYYPNLYQWAKRMTQKYLALSTSWSPLT